MNILVTSARAFISLDIIRVLCENGHNVWTVDSLFCPIAKYSPFIKVSSTKVNSESNNIVENKYIKIPSPKFNFTEFSEAIIDICNKNSIDFIIPTSEEIFYLAQIKKLPSFTKLQSISLEELNKLHNKANFAELANKLGYGTGDFLIFSSLDEFNEHIQKIGVENLKNYVAKPVYSRFASQALVSPNLEQIKTIKPSKDNPYLLQKKMIGKEICLYCVASQGELLAHIAYFPEFRTSSHGASLYFSPVSSVEQKDLAIQIQKLARDFIANTNFTGQVSFDIIATNDGLVPIECNPRGTSGVHLLAQQSILFADALIGKSHNFDKNYLDAFNYKPMMLAFPIVLKHPFAIFHSDKRRMLKNAQDVLKINNITLIKSIVSITEIFVISLRNNISFTEATTVDIEWNG